MALRHQLAVLARSATRSQCSPVGRCVWVLLSMVWSRWQEALTIVQPGTVRRWRRQGWRHHLRHHASALVAGGAYAELAHRLQPSSITVIHVFQRWLDSWTTSGAKQSAQWDTVSLTPPSSTASVPSLWAPAPVDRVCVPERSPPDSQQPCYHDLAPADVPRALETANMCLAAWAMVRWKVSPFRRRQVPRETTGQARGTSW
jgi:hypothetical protein